MAIDGEEPGAMLVRHLNLELVSVLQEVWIVAHHFAGIPDGARPRRATLRKLQSYLDQRRSALRA